MLRPRMLVLVLIYAVDYSVAKGIVNIYQVVSVQGFSSMLDLIPFVEGSSESSSSTTSARCDMDPFIGFEISFVRSFESSWTPLKSGMSAECSLWSRSCIDESPGDQRAVRHDSTVSRSSK